MVCIYVYTEVDVSIHPGRRYMQATMHQPMAHGKPKQINYSKGLQ